jgi:hypothetical protein
MNGAIELPTLMFPIAPWSVGKSRLQHFVARVTQMGVQDMRERNASGLWYCL